MQRQRFTALASAVVLALGFAASPAAAQVDTGSADFTRYVALGDSLTAGFTSGGLQASAQENSYPILLWQQVTGSKAGFEQPLVSAPGIPPLLELRSLSPLVIAPSGASNGAPLNLTLPRPYNNLAVPGSRVSDTANTFTGGLHDVVLRPGPQGFGTATALQQALALQPTFVSLWIGNNDALAAATSGIVIDGVTLTTAGQFEAQYRNLVNTIRGVSGAQMVLFTVPSVTSIPFVTTVPPVLVDPATQQPVVVGGQTVPLLGPNGPLGPGDRVLLPASAALAQGIGIPAQVGGTGVPLGDGLVLDAGEVARISERVASFNAVIRSVAQETGSALVDISQIFDEIAANGLSIGGLSYSAAFLRGGIFSYDGVHATDFGYAYLTSRIIEAINDTYGAQIPQINLFPFTFGSGTNSIVAADQAATAIYTPEAYEHLRKAMGILPTARLERIKERRNRHSGTGSGGNGSGGDGDDPPGGGRLVDRPEIDVDDAGSLPNETPRGLLDRPLP